MLNASVWPTTDYSRVPYRFYHDTSIYELERERLFKGPTWSHVGLEAEVPNAGDFRASYIGEAPIIIHRDAKGDLHGFVNRCAHRGAIVRRELQGNAKDHVCIYHQWCYGQDGRLIGVPFRRGIKGKGGYGKDFDLKNYGLTKVRIGSAHGVLFGTMSEEAEPLGNISAKRCSASSAASSRGPCGCSAIIDSASVETGRASQKIHAIIITQACYTTFSAHSVSTVRRRLVVRRWITATAIALLGDAPKTAMAAKAAYSSEQVASAGIKLRESSLVEYHPDRNDDINIAIVSLFPNCVIAQISNSMATRQIRPRGPAEFEVFQTVIGYQDDTPEMTQHRLRQANLVGPAGFVSMEDGEAIEIVQRATKAAPDAAQVLELGGKGEISDRDYRINDVPVRGFWSYYSELLGIEPEGGVR